MCLKILLKKKNRMISSYSLPPTRTWIKYDTIDLLHVRTLLQMHFCACMMDNSPMHSSVPINFLLQWIKNSVIQSYYAMVKSIEMVQTHMNLCVCKNSLQIALSSIVAVQIYEPILLKAENTPKTLDN